MVVFWKKKEDFLNNKVKKTCLLADYTLIYYGKMFYCEWKSQNFTQPSAQWCVFTNSSPLGVGQAPVENAWGTYKIKNVAQKKLAIKGTFRLIPYLHKKLSLSTMNWPCPRPEQQKWVFWQMQKSRFLILEIKSHMLKNSTVFNIL